MRPARRILARPRARSVRHALVAVSAALLIAPLGLLPVATPAVASQPSPSITNTSQFTGVNWARIGDNFSTGPLVPQGLDIADSYQTVWTKSQAMLTAFQHIGANTVRLPINPATVNTTTAIGPDWWDSYKAAINAATARGFKVVLSYWEEGSQGGKILNMATWNAMWNTVVATYLHNPLVYFDPMNEPHGYTADQWMDIAAGWISDRPSIPRNRIIVSGVVFDWDILPLCHDSRFNGTYLAFHHYSGDDPDITTYAGWVANFKSYVGDCASRTILEEFGAPMDSGLNYDDPNSTDPDVQYLRAYTDMVRSLHMGSIYWAGIGGRYNASDSVGAYDNFDVQRLNPNGANTPLWTPDTTGLDRLQYGWGIGSGSPTTTLRSSMGSNCVEGPGATTDFVAAVAAPCRGEPDQRWARTSTGQITVDNGVKCLDAYAGGTDNGTVVGVYPCDGGTNEQWALYSDDTIHGLQSGLCLGVDKATSELELQDCSNGVDQQWKTV